MHSVTSHSRKFFFIFKFLEDTSPLCGATKTPVLDFWWCLLWVSKPEWAVLLVLSRGIHVTHSLRLTSGATPADLLATSMAAKPISSTYLTCDHALVGLKRETYHATGKRSTDWAMPARQQFCNLILPNDCVSSVLNSSVLGNFGLSTDAVLLSFRRLIRKAALW